MSTLPPRTQHRRRRRWVLGLVALFLLLAAGDLAVRSILLRSDLAAARADVSRLRGDLLARDTAAVAADLRSVRRSADGARAQAHSVPITAWALVPWLGDPGRTVRGAADAVDALARRALPSLAAVDADVARTRSARTGSIDLAPLEQAAAPLRAALTEVAAQVTLVDALPSHTYLSPVDHARAVLLGQLRGLADELAAASAAAETLPGMLGAHGPRNYFLAFENEAEARGLGGLPGAFAIVRADQGHLHFVHFGNDSELDTSAGLGLSLGKDFTALYGRGVGAEHIFVNSDVSPHFPDAAEIWMAMWKAKTGQQLDGALVTDPTALSYLLAVTGPTRLSDGTAITAANVVDLTESAAYARYSDVAARKRFFLRIARAAADQLVTHLQDHEVALAHALARAIGERRLLAYSTRPLEEQDLAAEPIGGILPETNAPFSALSVINGAGSKLDYYLGRTLTYRAGPCRGGLRPSQVTVRLTNGAPASGLPGYVTIRADAPPGTTVAGSERLLVNIYATSGARLSSAILDGAPLLVQFGQERGHPVFTVDLTLEPGQTRTVVMNLTEPAARGAPQTVVQPLVLPQRDILQAARCSW